MQENYIDQDEKFKETARRSYENFIEQVGESMAHADNLYHDMGEDRNLNVAYATEGGPISYQDLYEGGFLSFGATISGPGAKEMNIMDQWAIIILSGGGPASRLVIKQDNELNLKVWYQYQDWGKYWLNVYVDDNTNELILNWLFNYVDGGLQDHLETYFKYGQVTFALNDSY